MYNDEDNCISMTVHFQSYVPGENHKCKITRGLLCRGSWGARVACPCVCTAESVAEQHALP